MSGSVQFNDIHWEVHLLGEQVVLLKCGQTIPIERVHQSTSVIEEIMGDQLLDIVPAYDSIALFTQLKLNAVIQLLENASPLSYTSHRPIKKVEIPICYELGLDLDALSAHTRLPKEEIISIHLSGLYRSLFIGFTPGFIYADGLDPALSCPRKARPRTHVEAGSIGIGGVQTGIYSLDSPGGWNIIGRTPIQLFDAHREPPMLIETGTAFHFYRISQEAFEEWVN